MTKTTAPSKTPSPNGGTNQATQNSGITTEQARRDFFVGAMNMSWQLAIVVLVPILGGYELDKTLDTAPVFTLVGFFVAMAGTGAVVWRQLQLLSPVPQKEGKS